MRYGEVEVRELLHDVLHDLEEVAQVRSFEEAGVLTYNEGLVVQLDDGSEFQLTLVRSR